MSLLFREGPDEWVHQLAVLAAYFPLDCTEILSEISVSDVLRFPVFLQFLDEFSTPPTRLKSRGNEIFRLAGLLEIWYHIFCGALIHK